MIISITIMLCVLHNRNIRNNIKFNILWFLFNYSFWTLVCIHSAYEQCNMTGNFMENLSSLFSWDYEILFDMLNKFHCVELLVGIVLRNLYNFVVPGVSIFLNLNWKSFWHIFAHQFMLYVKSIPKNGS
jgi:hypothetical protein